MGYKTDMARVRGLGAAGEGIGHWWTQRLTSLALIPLTVLFVFPFGRALGSGHEAMIAIYSSWWNALVAVAFIIVACWHLTHGLHTIIEDYVSDKGMRTALDRKSVV